MSKHESCKEANRHPTAPVALIRLPDVPIVVLQPALPVEEHLPALRRLWLQTVQLASRGPARAGVDLVAIIDLTGQDLSFADILLWLDEYGAALPAIPPGIEIRVLVAGQHPLIQVGFRKFNACFGMQLAQYDSLDAALLAAHQIV